MLLGYLCAKTELCRTKNCCFFFFWPTPSLRSKCFPSTSSTVSSDFFIRWCNTPNIHGIGLPPGCSFSSSTITFFTQITMCNSHPNPCFCSWDTLLSNRLCNITGMADVFFRSWRPYSGGTRTDKELQETLSYLNQCYSLILLDDGCLWIESKATKWQPASMLYW